MIRSLRKFLFVLVIFALFITACSIGGARTPTTDPQAIYTAAAQTVGAELTRSGALTPSATFTSTITATELVVTTTTTPTPTVTFLAPTQPPTDTPTTSKLPDRAEFVSQVIADGARFNPGQIINMKWVIKNIGTTTWTTAYAARFYAGDQMGAVASVKFTKVVKPGDTIEISVDFTAPNSTGKKSSIWVLQNPDGINYYSFYLNIEVVAAPPTNTPQPATLTPTPQATFTVTPTPTLAIQPTVTDTPTPTVTTTPP